MTTATVVKGFVVFEATKHADGKTAYRKVSRRFHVRSAAEQFKELATAQAQAQGSSVKFYVSEAMELTVLTAAILGRAAGIFLNAPTTL